MTAEKEAAFCSTKREPYCRHSIGTCKAWVTLHMNDRADPLQTLQAGAPGTRSRCLRAGRLPADGSNRRWEAFAGTCQLKTKINLKLGRGWVCVACYFSLSTEGML